ncbi:Uncharacterised protein [Serratia proteamaculans]|nr:Uncharacterised protein [Serratia proteamaculans]
MFDLLALTLAGQVPVEQHDLLPENSASLN